MSVNAPRNTRSNKVEVPVFNNMAEVLALDLDEEDMVDENEIRELMDRFRNDPEGLVAYLESDD